MTRLLLLCFSQVLLASFSFSLVCKTNPIAEYFGISRKAKTQNEGENPLCEGLFGTLNCCTNETITEATEILSDQIDEWVGLVEYLPSAYIKLASLWVSTLHTDNSYFNLTQKETKRAKEDISDDYNSYQSTYSTNIQKCGEAISAHLKGLLCLACQRDIADYFTEETDEETAGSVVYTLRINHDSCDSVLNQCEDFLIDLRQAHGIILILNSYFDYNYNGYSNISSDYQSKMIEFIEELDTSECNIISPNFIPSSLKNWLQGALDSISHLVTVISANRDDIVYGSSIDVDEDEDEEVTLFSDGELTIELEFVVYDENTEEDYYDSFSDKVNTLVSNISYPNAYDFSVYSEVDLDVPSANKELFGMIQRSLVLLGVVLWGGGLLEVI